MIAAIYCRVSSDKQEQDGSSLETQLAENTRFAREQGYEVRDDTVVSESFTGKVFYERPGLNTIRELIRSRKVDALIAFKLDRIARDQAHMWIVYEECRKHDVKLLFTTERFEDNPMGRAILAITAAWAEMEREMIRDRTKRGRYARVEREGLLLPGPRPPYGYEWVDDHKSALLPAADQRSDVMRRVFNTLADGASAYGVAEMLNAERVPTPSGKVGARWFQSTITQLVNNPIYKGEVRALAHRARAEGEEVPYSERYDDATTLPSSVVPEPLVSAELWNAVQQRLKQNRTEARRRNPRPDNYLLRAGFARCGYCGCALTVKRAGKSKAKFAYACCDESRKRHGHPCVTYPTHALDDEVWQMVKTVFTRPDLIKQRLEMRDDDPHAAERALLERVVADIEQKESSIATGLRTLTNASVIESLVVDLNELGERRQALSTELAALEASRRQWEARREQAESILRWAARIGAKLGEAVSYKTKRDMLHALGVTVHVYAKCEEERVRLTADLPVSPRDLSNEAEMSVAIANESTCSSVRNITLSWRLGEPVEPPPQRAAA